MGKTAPHARGSTDWKLLSFARRPRGERHVPAPRGMLRRAPGCPTSFCLLHGSRMSRFLHTVRRVCWCMSAAVFAITIALWVRSIGHFESWAASAIDPTEPDKSGYRQVRITGIAAFAIDGTFECWWWTHTWEHAGDGKRLSHWRAPVSPDEKTARIDEFYPPGDREYQGGRQIVHRAGPFAFARRRGTVSAETGQPKDAEVNLVMPFWALATTFGLWPLSIILRRATQPKRAEGACRNCGYDLRATPERCPECGQVTEQPSRHG